MTISAFGKIEPLKGRIVYNSNQFEKIGNDTILQVSYINPSESDRKPAIYLDGKYINETIIKTINPQIIDSIKVVKHDVKLDGKNYNGQIFIQLKKSYNPKLISLADIKLKYLNLTNASSIFMIDNEMISGDYSKCIVDENYILKIIVEKIENNEENLKVNIIRLITKTEENIKKSKQIWIRGTEELMHER